MEAVAHIFVLCVLTKLLILFFFSSYGLNFLQSSISLFHFVTVYFLEKASLQLQVVTI